MTQKLLSFLLCVILLSSCKLDATKNLKCNQRSIENTSNKYRISAVLEYKSDTGQTITTKVFTDIEPGEIRSLDTQSIHSKFFKIRSAHYEKLSYTDLVADGLKFMALFIATILTLVGSIAVYRYQRSTSTKHEVKILIAEMEDVKRHLKANLDLIKQFKIEKNGVPLDFYIKRLQTWDDLIMNSQETYKNIHGRKTKYLAHARLLVRNVDIECESLLAYIKENKVDVNTLKDHVIFIKNKHLYLIAWIRITIRYLKKWFPNYKKFRKEIQDIRINKDKLIYEKTKKIIITNEIST